MAISHFIVANSLPFSLTSDYLFRRILQLARNVNNNYAPPGRNAIVKVFLPKIHQSYRDNQVKNFQEAGEDFGGTLHADGATIRKIPLVNVLCSNPGEGSCLLDVVDCSEHMSEDGKKDAWYLAKMMLPLMREVDPNKVIFGYVVFDGASNFQKAAKLIGEHFPRVTVGRGIEHTVALIFSRLARQGPIWTLCVFCSIVSDAIVIHIFKQSLTIRFCNVLVS